MLMLTLGIVSVGDFNVKEVSADGSKIGESSGAQQFYTDFSGYGGVYLFYQDASMTKPAYCLNRDNSEPNGQTFVKYDALDVNKISFSDYWGKLKANPGENTDPTNLEGAQEMLPLILYIGYPNDAGNLGTEINNNKRFQALTQAAIWHYTDKRDEKLSGESSNPILDYINNHNDLEVPDSLKVQIWTWDQYSASRYQNMLMVTNTTPKISEDPSIKSTTLTATAGSKTSTASDSAAAQLSLAGSEVASIRDEVVLEQLDTEKDYILVSKLYKVDGETKTEVSGSEVVTNVPKSEIDATTKKVTKTVTFTKTLDEAGEYQIYSELYEESRATSNLKSKHNDKYNQKAETVNITKEAPTTPYIDSTSVTIAGKTGSPVTVTTEEANSVSNFTDTIVLKNLDSTKTYFVSLTLKMLDSTYVPVTTQSENINGVTEKTITVTIPRSNYSFQDGKTYTVVTKLEESTDGVIFTHNDNLKDQKETIVVKDPEAPKISITVNKEWYDGDTKLTEVPTSGSIKLQLIQNGVNGEIVEVTADSNWSYTWNNLASDARYEVKEVSCDVEGFEIGTDKVSVVDNVATIKNIKKDEVKPDPKPDKPNKPTTKTYITPKTGVE